MTLRRAVRVTSDYSVKRAVDCAAKRISRKCNNRSYTKSLTMSMFLDHIIFTIFLLIMRFYVYFVLQSMKSSLLDFYCCILYLTIHVGDSLGTTVSVSRYKLYSTIHLKLEHTQSHNLCTYHTAGRSHVKTKCLSLCFY